MPTFRTPYKNRDVGTRLAQPACGKSLTDPSHAEPIEKKIKRAIEGNYLGTGRMAFDVSSDMSVEQAERTLSIIDRKGFDLSDIPPYMARVKAAYEAAKARLDADKKAADAAAAAKSGEAITKSNGSEAANQSA